MSSAALLQALRETLGDAHVLTADPATATNLSADSGDLTAYTDHEIAWEMASGEPWMRIAARIARNLPPKVWISFDIDGLDPALCANTGTPVPGGLSWRDTTLLLQLLADEHQIVGFDLCEVGAEDFDANVGARLLYRMASWAIHTRHRDC
jgi:agmatinase